MQQKTRPLPPLRGRLAMLSLCALCLVLQLPAATVGFVATSSTVVEGGTASIDVRMDAAPPNDVTVVVSNTGTGSATNGSDHVPFAPTTLVFPANSSYPLTLSVALISTDEPNVEAAETVVLGLALTAGTATLGITLHTLTITDNDPATATGCSSSQSPYLVPLLTGTTTRSLLTTGDMVGGYRMVGAPDGLGAFDNGNGTFTLLMNHEIQSSQGVTRAHGSAGAFVSQWVIDKNTLCVQSGQDLVQTVYTWNGSGYTAGTTAFAQLCSADLPAVSALYNAATGNGTQERILFNGEEASSSGRAFANIVTGTEARRSYQLPRFGRATWENVVPCPIASDKTVVAVMEDSGPGQVYFYIGTKQNSGTTIEKAGLHNGNLYGMAVSGLATESNGSVPTPGTAFTLANLGNVSSLTGSQLGTASNAAGVTNFQRPEDGAWDPNDPRDFYFNTANAFSAPTRLWRLRFTDPLQPELGGTITAVLDGTEGLRMLDNLCIDRKGRILLQEDVGNSSHNCKVWRYTIATDALELVAQHDPARFVSGGANFLTQNEESSGVIDVSHILGEGKYLLDVMAHYGTTTELVEGGQLLLLNTGSSVALNVRVHLEGPYRTGAGTMSDALRTNGLLPVVEPYTALGLTPTPGDTGTTNAAVLALADANNAIVDWVVLELRSAANPAAVVSRRSALLQRDGEVVGLNGSGPVYLKVADGNYHVAVRHRNHLGTMTAAPVSLSNSPAAVNFTAATTVVFGTDARKPITGTFPTLALWAGDVNTNNAIMYSGQGNDRDPILNAIGGVVPTNSVNGYRIEDANLDGTVLYSGAGNDRDIILQNIGGVVPTNVKAGTLP